MHKSNGMNTIIQTRILNHLLYQKKYFLTKFYVKLQRNKRTGKTLRKCDKSDFDMLMLFRNGLP